MIILKYNVGYDRDKNREKQESPPLIVNALLIDTNRSSPSTVKPQRFGAGPAIYAHALSSVSFKNTCPKADKHGSQA